MKPMHAAMAVLVTMIWGFNFPVSKLVLREFSPLLAMTLRYALVALVLVPFAKVPRANCHRIGMIAPILRSKGVDKIVHILPDGRSSEFDESAVPSIW